MTTKHKPYRKLPRELEFKLEMLAADTASSDSKSVLADSESWCAVVISNDGTKTHPLWSDLVGFAFADEAEWFGIKLEAGRLVLDSDRGADFAEWLSANGGTYGDLGFHTHCLAWAVVGKPTKVFVWAAADKLDCYWVL